MFIRQFSKFNGPISRAARASITSGGSRFNRSATFAGLLMVAAVALSTSAVAQTVTGAIDPSTGLSNLAPYFLTLVAGASVLITAWKGTHAVAEGRSLGPSIVGLVGGLALAFGGYYVMSKYGVATST